MADSVKVTPASRKIEFFNPTTAAAKSTISLDTSGNLTIVADGTIDIGDTSADIYVGDGSSNVDIVYTVDGEIRTEGSGVELSIVSAETITMTTPTLEVGGNIAVTGDDKSITFDGGTKVVGDHSSDGLQIRTQDTQPIVFKTNGNNTRMSIEGDGKIGIGTTSPKFPLHLTYTDTRTDPEGSGSSSGAGAIGASAEGGGLYLQNASNANGVWSGVTFRSGTADARIAYKYLGGPNSGDNEGFNEGQMSFYLDVDDGDVYGLSEVLRLRGGSTHANAATDYNLAYVNGRIGVGTTTPDDLIEIMNGGLKITREETEDGSVVEDSVGLSVAAGLKWTFSKSFDDPNPVPIGTTTDNDVRILRNNGTAHYWFWNDSRSYLNMSLEKATPPSAFRTTDTNIAANDVLGQITFSAPYEGTGTDALLNAGIIKVLSEGDFSASSNASAMTFSTGASEAATEKMRITSAGAVGIGTLTPATNLHIADTGTTHITPLRLDNGIDTDGGRGVGMDFRVRFTSSNIHTSQIYFDFYGDKWTDSIGMNYVSGRSGSFSHHHFRDQAGATQLMIADNGNVGIGSGFTHAAQPGSTLDVVAAGTTGHGLKVYRNQSSSNMDSALVYLHDDSQYADEAVIHVKQDGTGSAGIFEGGHVGIGVTAPTESLAVRGGIKIGEFNDTDGTGYAGTSPPSAHNLGTGAADPQLRVSGRSTGNPGIIQMAQFDANNFLGGTTEFVLGRLQYAMNENSNEVTTVAEIRGITSRPNDPGHFDGALTFLTSQGDASSANLTEKMMLTADGNLGIGQFPFTRNGATAVNGPDTMLHLASGTGDVTLKIEADIENDTESHNPMLWLTQDGGLVHFKMGIQETGNHAYLKWEASTDKDLIFYNDTNERMRITGDGNVGIGDSTPSYKLDVNGTGRFTSDLIGNQRIRTTRGAGEVELSSTDGVFIQEEYVQTGNTVSVAAYTNVSQNLSAFISRGNRVTTSGSGTNTAQIIGGKYYLFNVVMTGDASVIDHFQSWDATVYFGGDDHNVVHRKTIHALYDHVNSDLIFQYSNTMENQINFFDVGVEYALGNSTILGVNTNNITVARVYVTLKDPSSLTPNKYNTGQLDWSWEFTGLKDEAQVG